MLLYMRVKQMQKKLKHSGSTFNAISLKQQTESEYCG